ncbi:MAG: hypothetical protein P4K83_02555 [Terracidiphilus sp.]|nr:hypothetical protein [Terracidiphilus sp.]
MGHHRPAQNLEVQPFDSQFLCQRLEAPEPVVGGADKPAVGVRENKCTRRAILLHRLLADVRASNQVWQDESGLPMQTGDHAQRRRIVMGELRKDKRPKKQSHIQ